MIRSHFGPRSTPTYYGLNEESVEISSDYKKFEIVDRKENTLVE